MKCVTRRDEESGRITHECRPSLEEKIEWYENLWLLTIVGLIVIIILVVIMMAAAAKADERPD